MRRVGPGRARASTWSLAAAAVLGATLPASPALHAQERLVRTWTGEHGLPAPPVWALAQDDVGFLWVGAQGGLFRFDGTQFRRWARETIREVVYDVAVTPRGEVLALEGSGRLFRVTPDGAEPVPLPGPAVAGQWQGLVVDLEGGIWILRDGGVAYRSGDGAWETPGPDLLGGGRARRLLHDPLGGVLISTERQLWDLRFEGDELRAELLADEIAVRDVVTLDDGRRRVLVWAPENATWKVVDVDGDGIRDFFPGHHLPLYRPISMVARGGRYWVSLDEYLVTVGPEGETETLGFPEGVPSGGPLLVDREGSLWLGSYQGLHQFPEPDTRTFGEADGLPTRHTRFLGRSGEALWVATWRGPGVITRGERGWGVSRTDWYSGQRICVDAAGSGWTLADGWVAELRGEHVTRWTSPALIGPLGCAPARDGGVWLGGGEGSGLWHFHGERGEPRSVPIPPDLPPGTFAAPTLHDSRDRLWIAAGGRYCRGSVPGLLDQDPGTWECQVVPGAEAAGTFVELEDGRIWASSVLTGLLEFSGDEWRAHPMPDLPARSLLRLTHSPRGGIWMAGPGILQRVEPEPGGTWTVLERPSPWEGVTAGSGGDVLEDPDGTLWIAGSRGVVHVPPRARFQEGLPPTVALVEARVDDEPLALNEPSRLSHRRNRVELRFAALSYRDRSRLRHQVRLGPGEPWTESRGEPTFRWVDLRPGIHQVEYRASLDGLVWSADPARFRFQVLPPWYATWRFLLLAGAAVALAAWAAYRTRVAYLVGLERQRTRIAMDLHDEVGSGLASVGILSGVIARDGLGEEERRRTALEISEAAEELGSSLSDIVWSLDPRTASMEELATRLAEHGERLCADGPRFTARFPDPWPRERTDVAVRRTVVLIGLEALHNAVRHGAASQVTLTLRPHPSGEWELSVSDDGRGLPEEVGLERAGRAEGGKGGRGIPGMSRRAREIGARLSVESRSGAGTRVTLRFRPMPGRTGRVAGALGRLFTSGPGERSSTG